VICLRQLVASKPEGVNTGIVIDWLLLQIVQVIDVRYADVQVSCAQSGLGSLKKRSRQVCERQFSGFGESRMVEALLNGRYSTR